MEEIRMAVNVKAEWSGVFPHRCEGFWSLEVDGVDVTSKIPEAKIDGSMKTFGLYRKYSSFVNDECTRYFAGLKVDEWISSNKYWLDTISEDLEVQTAIFNAISEHDLRGCCGGCT
jgi:hypothetical protein